MHVNYLLKICLKTNLRWEISSKGDWNIYQDEFDDLCISWVLILGCPARGQDHALTN